jgi:rhamnulose-1-phosphate aldolase
MRDIPYPTLDHLLKEMGEAGKHLTEIDACEGAAGNITICINWPINLTSHYQHVEHLRLPVNVPRLAGATIIATGSGQRLRELADDPTGNTGGLLIDEDGSTAQLYTVKNRMFKCLTSELNSHLAIHNDQWSTPGMNFHALIHAQPPHLTYLSHLPFYQDENALNQRLLRWQPESIIQFPEGLGILPFLVPGSESLMMATVECLRKYCLILWSKHGVMARSKTSVKQASDLIDYAEAAARYEYLNLTNGEKASGLSVDEISAIKKAFGLDQKA